MFCENFKKHYGFNLLMDLLINSDDKLCLYFLENIKDLYFDKKDFYKKRKNSKILLFEAFNDKCKYLFTKFGNSKGTYTFKVKKIIDSILYDLQNSNINFGLLKSVITEDEDFENKLKRITSNEKEAKDLFNKLKDNYNQFQKDFNDIEIILDYYTTFYPNSKEELIKLIKIKQKEYKEDKMINELINMDIKNFYNIKNFYLKEAIEESINIKYKYSIFFMILYKNHLEKDKSEKSEDKILKESITDYIDIFKDIIEKLESKKSLYDINNIELIINEALNSNFDLDKEINLIIQEFSFLNKKDYLLYNFKNDFIFFIEQFQFIKLIQGIIKFIEYNFKINDKKETTIFNSLRNIYKSINENKINEKYTNEALNILY